MCELYQIYYDESQLPKLYPFAIPYYNKGLTIFFESSVIKDIVLSTEADKIGVVSWKLKDKMRWYIGRPRELTQEILESDYEVMSFTKNTKDHHMLAAADRWHPGFLTTFDKILAKIGVSRPGEVKIPIYQNHHCSKTEIYKDYIQKYLSPAMDCMTNDPEINALAIQDSKYSDLTHQSADHLFDKIGMRIYPIAPFLLERLFSIYVHNFKINVTHL